MEQVTWNMSDLVAKKSLNEADMTKWHTCTQNAIGLFEIKSRQAPAFFL